MECPRCGSPLERYTLGERTAVTCGTCGYADVSVDHHTEPETAETWADALSRVSNAARIASVTVETAEESPALELAFEASPEENSPEPTVVRVENPDPELAAALSAATGEKNGEQFICEVCGRTFDRREQLYGHLAVHSEKERGDT